MTAAIYLRKSCFPVIVEDTRRTNSRNSFSCAILVFLLFRIAGLPPFGDLSEHAGQLWNLWNTMNSLIL